MHEYVHVYICACIYIKCSLRELHCKKIDNIFNTICTVLNSYTYLYMRTIADLFLFLQHKLKDNFGSECKVSIYILLLYYITVCMYMYVSWVNFLQICNCVTIHYKTHILVLANSIKFTLTWCHWVLLCIVVIWY